MIDKTLRQDFAQTLLSGGYNILLGSGVSLDSLNTRGDSMLSAESLRKRLCQITEAPENTSLTSVYPLLTDEEREREIIGAYRCSKPGDSLRDLPRFLWQRIFTFNVDDVVEKLYESHANPKQVLVSKNFDESFEPTPDRQSVKIVHLHGYIRRSDSGFVFSNAEYARAMRGINQWSLLLGQIIPTEPFIISGTSLSEVDLEYYLGQRTAHTPRKNRGPSLLVEPFPTKVTRAACERHGLTLVQATFGEFLDWLISEYPAPPSLSMLMQPDVESLFDSTVTKSAILRFYTDFEIVPTVDAPIRQSISPFFHGRPPEWNDIHQHLDIERRGNTKISSALERALDSSSENRIVLLLDEPGSGKTTTIKRIAHDYARLGKTVFSLKAPGGIDVKAAVSVLSGAKTDVVLVVDGFADHVDAVLDILSEVRSSGRIVILGSERSYRKEYINLILSDTSWKVVEIPALDLNESHQLIELYRRFGLVGSDLIHNPDNLAKMLINDPVAVAVCRIMNDFAPFDRICSTIWDDSLDDDKVPYLCAAIAFYCYRSGLRYSILQSILGPTLSLSATIERNSPLSLSYHEDNDEFVVPTSSVVADRLLQVAAHKQPQMMLDAFMCLGRALAPHVNRRALIQKSPEARLAGRLFDSDKVVYPLLQGNSNDFYVAMQPLWAWNSRYWEQRALLTAEKDMDTAVSYARHAVAIERHPHTLTTLGKLLIMQLEKDSSDNRLLFGEALNILIEAIRMEAYRSRVAIHPYMNLLRGSMRYMELGGELSFDQEQMLYSHADKAKSTFSADKQVKELVTRLRAMRYLKRNNS